LVVFAVAMNAPFFWLAANFDYPDVLRRGAPEVLQLVREGGSALIAAWYAYALVALAFAPLSLALLRRLRPAQDGLGSLASWLGVGAALTQALGLLRWVFVVPVLAQLAGDPSAEPAQREAAGAAFQALHQMFGVAIGEHLGQLFTALWLALVSVELLRERARWPVLRDALDQRPAQQGQRHGAAHGAQPQAARVRRGSALAFVLGFCGLGISSLLLIGLVEGFATVMPLELGPLALLTPIGFMAFSVWLAALGVGIARSHGESGLGGRSGPCGGSARAPE
jgi:hypothetical protein